ncbi:MAG: CDP-alcohol phosphatidyltransferase family protein [Anaerotignum sp.]|nr:CDP-alcohol phosphatidyltransferase family protein [Anaerotignum sp.]
MKKQIANFITGCRILGSVFLLFFSVFSIPFYMLYLFCGITDMVDGTIARKTGSVSEFGAKLDSAADIIFVTVSLLKFLPVLDIPNWLWFWMVSILIIRISNLIVGFIFQKRFMALHTVMNKLAGLLLFILPLTLQFIELEYTAVIVCTVATIAALQDGYRMKKGCYDLKIRRT